MAAKTPKTPRTRKTPRTSKTPRTPRTPRTRPAVPAPGPAAGSATSGASPAGATAGPPIQPGGPTGDDILELALTHEGEEYVLGARAPMANKTWTGPWDCAEFCSWCVFQVTGILYGARPADDPVLADAFTGFWGNDVASRGIAVSVEDAMRTAGACLLRKPRTGRVGHIVFSDGKGGTMEAHSSARGLIRHTAAGRRWDVGVLVPGVRYFMGEEVVFVEPAPPVLRVTQPMMRGPRVKAVQEALKRRGYPVGDVDSVYGPQTEAAVLALQADEGLLPDGEVGPETAGALGI